MPKTERVRWLLLLPLALAHLMLALWLNARHAPAPRGVPAPALSIVRLDLEAPRPPAPRVPLPEARLPLPVVVPIAPPRLDDIEPSPNAITPTQPATPRSAAAAAAASPAPLNLALPPAPSASQPWRNPALSDPRANTRRADYATRMADALGTDTSLREESLGPGRHRFRQGTTCVETAESRIAQIDPMGATMRGAPQLVTSCK